jgi:hypothetical protein
VNPARIFPCIAHILQHRPETTASVLVQYLRLPHWYFAQVTAPTGYDRGAEFSAHSMQAAIRGRPDAFAGCAPACFAYALVTFREVLPNELLPALVQGLDTEGYDNEALVYNEIQRRGISFQEALGGECLTWGVCCGDLLWATRALALYRRFLHAVDTAVVDRLIVNIRVAASVARERPTPAIVDYVSSCWETLRLVAARVGARTAPLLALTVAFLECTEPEILATVLAVAAWFVQTAPIPAAAADAMRATLCRPLRVVAPDGLFALLVAAARTGIPVLGSEAPLAAVLLLVLPLFGTDITDRTFLATLLRGSEAASNLRQIADAPADDEVLEFETALHIADAMSDEELAVTANILGALMAASGFKRCLYLYSFVITLMGNARSPQCFTFFVECGEKDQENVFLRNSLLEIFDGLKCAGAPAGGAAPIVFPVIECPLLVLRQKEVDFAEIADWPPLLITDPEFKDCAIVQAIKETVKRIDVAPFTAWAAEFATGRKAVVAPDEGVELPRFDGDAALLDPAWGLPCAEGPLHVIGVDLAGEQSQSGDTPPGSRRASGDH